jgi:hypothetical protein
VAVKLPLGDGSDPDEYAKYKTKEGIFWAVSRTLVKRFQSALVAQCHQGTFFEDIGHLADGPVAQQILLGTYEYSPDLDPANWLLFKKATAAYAALSPSEVATYVTVEDFQYFSGNAPKNARGCCIVGCISGTTRQHHYVMISLLCTPPNYHW